MVPAQESLKANPFRNTPKNAQISARFKDLLKRLCNTAQKSHPILNNAPSWQTPPSVFVRMEWKSSRYIWSTIRRRGNRNAQSFGKSAGMEKSEPVKPQRPGVTRTYTLACVPIDRLSPLQGSDGRCWLASCFLNSVLSCEDGTDINKGYWRNNQTASHREREGRRRWKWLWTHAARARLALESDLLLLLLLIVPNTVISRKPPLPL